jgi:hypothetical protein
MQAEVDQSGKFEWTQKATVLALANGTRFTIRISAREKRLIQQELKRRKPEWSKNLVKVYVFSVLVYLLLRDRMAMLDRVIIDTEYTGYEAVIKNRILSLCRRQGMKVFADQIVFQQVGKKSPAHKAAIAVFRAEVEPDKEVRAADVLAEF